MGLEIKTWTNDVMENAKILDKISSVDTDKIQCMVKKESLKYRNAGINRDIAMVLYVIIALIISMVTREKYLIAIGFGLMLMSFIYCKSIDWSLWDIVIFGMYTFVLYFNSALLLVYLGVLVVITIKEYLNMEQKYQTSIKINKKFIWILCLYTVLISTIDYYDLVNLRENIVDAESIREEDIQNLRKNLRESTEGLNLPYRIEYLIGTAKDRSIIYDIIGNRSIEKLISDIYTFELEELSCNGYVDESFEEYKDLGTDGVYKFIDNSLADLKSKYTYPEFMKSGASIKEIELEDSKIGTIKLKGDMVKYAGIDLINSGFEIGSEVDMIKGIKMQVKNVERYSEEEFNNMNSKELGVDYIKYLRSELKEESK